MTHLRSQRDIYNSLVLAALAQCIHILPTGACVDLSDGEKALVLEENPANFSHPMILKFSNNLIYDLSDPAINKNLKIVDIMKTMDNRIAIDEHTLEHFVADAYIKETADRFRKKKLESAQQRQSELKKQAMDSLMDSATVLSSEEEMNPVKKPRKKMKLL